MLFHPPGKLSYQIFLVHGCVNVPSSKVYRKWSLPSLCTPHPACFPGSASPQAEGEFLGTSPCLLWSPPRHQEATVCRTETQTLFLFIKSQEAWAFTCRACSPPFRRRSQAPPTVGFLQGLSGFSDGGKGSRDWKEKRNGGCEASDPKRPALQWLRESRPTQPPAKARLLPISKRGVAPHPLPVHHRVLDPGPPGPPGPPAPRAPV